MTSLNNLVACNDTFGIASSELSTEAIAKIKEVLGLENLYVNAIPRYPLPGTYMKMNNFGMLVPNDLTPAENKTLAELVRMPVANGSCSGGKTELGKEFVINSTKLLCDKTSLQIEISRAKTIFNIVDKMYTTEGMHIEDGELNKISGEEFKEIKDELDIALLESIL